MTSVIVYIAVNVVFNYTLAVLLTPGCLKEFYCSQEKEKINKELDNKKVERAKINNISGELKKLMKLSKTSIHEISKDWEKR